MISPELSTTATNGGQGQLLRSDPYPQKPVQDEATLLRAHWYHRLCEVYYFTSVGMLSSLPYSVSSLQRWENEKNRAISRGLIDAQLNRLTALKVVNEWKTRQGDFKGLYSPAELSNLHIDDLLGYITIVVPEDVHLGVPKDTPHRARKSKISQALAEKIESYVKIEDPGTIEARLAKALRLKEKYKFTFTKIGGTLATILLVAIIVMVITSIVMAILVANQTTQYDIIIGENSYLGDAFKAYGIGFGAAAVLTAAYFTGLKIQEKIADYKAAKLIQNSENTVEIVNVLISFLLVLLVCLTSLAIIILTTQRDEVRRLLSTIAA